MIPYNKTVLYYHKWSFIFDNEVFHKGDILEADVFPLNYFHRHVSDADTLEIVQDKYMDHDQTASGKVAIRNS